MNIFELERMIEDDEYKFIQLIEHIYAEEGINEALKTLKKSGLCINSYGSGKPKNSKLFKKIIKVLDADGKDSNTIKKSYEEVNIINNLFKKLNTLIKNDIDDNLSVDKQVISYIISLEAFLTDCANNNMGEILNIESTGLKDPNPNIYENACDSTGEILKYFLYKKYPFSNIHMSVTKEDIEVAGQHIFLAGYKKLLYNIEELWNYFEVEVLNGEEYIEFKAVGEHVLGKVVTTQKFFDIRNAKMSKFAYIESITNKKYSLDKKLPPSHFISSYEEMACEFIYEYLSISNLEYEFAGVSLSVMIRAYSIIALESETFLRKREINEHYNEFRLSSFCIVKTKNKWMKIFEQGGITKEIAEKIIELLTFNDTSKDLYDCPFIKFDDFYIIVPSLSNNTDASRSIISNLTSKGIDISIKGNEFEKQIRQSIIEAGINCINLKEQNIEWYECDSVFNIGKDIFFVEAKHLNHPLCYREYQRNLDEIESACNQLNRIVDYFTRDLERLKGRLGIKEIGNIYKIIVTNTATGEKLRYGDFLITDETLFLGYFKRKSPQIHIIKNKASISKSLFSEYYEGEISSQQFVRAIESNPYIELSRKRIRYKTLDYTQALGIIFSDYESIVDSIINADKLSEEERSYMDDIYNA